MSVRTVVIAALLHVPAIALSQTVTACPTKLTVRECLSLLHGQTAVRNEAADELNRKPTGVDMPGAKNLSIQDFVPRLATALAAPGLDAIDSLGTSINIPIRGVAIQLGAILFKPALYEPLIGAVPQNRRDSVRTRLEASLAEFHQPRVSAALNMENKSWGRRLRAHAGDISDLFITVEDSVRKKLKDAGLLSMTRLVEHVADHKRADFDVNNAKCAAVEDPFDAPISCFRESVRDTLLADIARTVGPDSAAAIRRRLFEELDIDRLADLINNQPQLIINVQHDALHWAVGPRQTHVEVRVEIGNANMNGLRGECGNGLGLECFRKYLTKANNAGALRQNRRFVFTFSAAYQPDYNAKFLPLDSAAFSLSSRLKWQGSVGYGWYVGENRGPVQDSRLDISARAMRQKEDGIRTKQRIVANATLTQRISDQLTSSIAVLWANKPEFIDDDATRIGASLGVRYKTIDKKSAAR